MNALDTSAIQRAILAMGNQQRLAEASGASRQAVSFWANGERRISAEFAIKVEEATGGQVGRHELRPDIWPAPAQAA